MKRKLRFMSIILSVVTLFSFFTLLTPVLASASTKNGTTEIQISETNDESSKTKEELGFVDKIVNAFTEFLLSLNIPEELIPFIISVFPVLELRGGMFAALGLTKLGLIDLNVVEAFLICYLGNMLPIPFILLFIRKIFALMRKSRFLSGIVDRLEKRAEKKKGTIQKYKEWGLLLFVAIPLPGTGGWTGALIAALMDLRMKKCLPIIALGVFIAGLIMSLITYGIF